MKRLFTLLTVLFLFSQAFLSSSQPQAFTDPIKLTADDGMAADFFGISVAVDGDTTVIGAEQHDIGPNNEQGAAYVFVRSGSTWTQQAKLVAADGSDLFGHSVSISGDTVIIGAYVDAIGTNAGQGSAYVFVRSGSTWAQQAKLVAADGTPNDHFGASVAIDGETALVGVPQQTGGQGSAYVFLRSGASWMQQAKLTADDGLANDAFANAVGISGDIAIVGPVNREAVYLFLRTGASWTQQQPKLTADDGQIGDTFGVSVAINGGTVIVGAYLDDVGSNTNQGSAYVFTLPDLICTINCTASAPPNATTGTSVSFAGTASPSAGCVGPPFFDWDFGDGSSHSSEQNPSHIYSTAGTYTWRMRVSINGECVQSGSISVSPVSPFWEQVNGPWPNQCNSSFGAIAVDPTNSNTIYIGGSNSPDGCGIYKSTDGGQTWIQKNNGIIKLGFRENHLPAISTIAISPSNRNVIYIGTYNDRGFGTTGYLYRSNDGGENWNDIRGERNFFGIPQIQTGILSLAIDPTDPNSAFVGVENDGVYKTDNGGSNWTKVRSDNLVRYHVLRVTPSRDIFIAGGQSLNNAPCFPGLNPGLQNARPSANCTGLLPSGPFRSTDSGVSWLSVPTPERVFITDFSIDPSNENILYFSTMGAGLATPFPILIDPKGILKSTDGGNSWAQINNGFGEDLANFAIYGVKIDPAFPDRLFALSPPNDVYQSVNQGANWQLLNGPSGITFIKSIATSPAKRLYALTSQGIHRYIY